MSSASSFSAYGVSTSLPPGWEGRASLPISVRPYVAVPNSPSSPPEAVRPFFHFGNFPLPPVRGSYGSGAVERMQATDMLVVLVEFSSESLGTALFSPIGLPRQLDPTQFARNALQRILPGQAGFQAFFTEAQRPFSLYVVVGSDGASRNLVPQVNTVLRSISISGNGS